MHAKLSRPGVAFHGPRRALFSLWVVACACALPAGAQTPPTTPPTTPPAASPVEDPRFDIFEYQVEGNTVLPVPEIERAVTPYLGEKRNIQDVERARKALEDAYQRIGYQTVFVDVPEQKVDGGVVRLRVLEGRIERLRISGNRYFSQGEIRAAVPDFAPGTVPDFNAVQRQLTALNRVADRQVTPVLRSGRTPGGMEVELVVKDQLPVHGEIELNNRSAAFTSNTRLVAGLRWDNLWQQQHSAGLSVQMSPEKSDEVRVLVGNYLWRMADRPDVIAAYAVASDSRVALVGASTVVGEATIAGLRWIRPLSGAGASAFHSLTLGLDYKKFAQTDIQAGTDALEVQAPLSYVPLSIGYGLTHGAEGQATQFNISATSAPRGLLGNSDAEFQSRRKRSSAGWTVFKFDATHERLFSPRWGLWTRLDAQWTDLPLISNEQFALGGIESVRGYREAELSADRGGRASIELRWSPWRLGADEIKQRALDAARDATAATPTASPGRPQATVTPLAPDVQSPLAALQFYALLDIGGVENLEPGDAQFTRRWIGGLGGGLRWNAPAGWRLQFDGARALNPGGSGLDGFITQKGDWRWHLRLGLDF